MIYCDNEQIIDLINKTVLLISTKFVMNMMLSQHLVSLNYSSCVSQIYISVHSFIALRISSSLHSYFEFSCHYRVSEFSYIDHHHIEKCIEAFLHYFYNNQIMIC